MSQNDPVEALRDVGFRASPDALRAFFSHATKSKLSPTQLALDLASLEKRERDARNLETRTRLSALGTAKSLDQFDWTHPRSIDSDLLLFF